MYWSDCAHASPGLQRVHQGRQIADLAHELHYKRCSADPIQQLLRRYHCKILRQEKAVRCHIARVGRRSWPGGRCCQGGRPTSHDVELKTDYGRRGGLSRRRESLPRPAVFGSGDRKCVSSAVGVASPGLQPKAPLAGGRRRAGHGTATSSRPDPRHRPEPGGSHLGQRCPAMPREGPRPNPACSHRVGGTCPGSMPSLLCLPPASNLQFLRGLPHRQTTTCVRLGSTPPPLIASPAGCWQANWDQSRMTRPCCCSRTCCARWAL